VLTLLYDRIAAVARWPVVAILFVVFIVCMQLFNARQEWLGCQNRVLDVRFWYTPEDAQSLFKAIGPGGRKLYAISQVTLDLLFPPVYGTLLAILIVRLFSMEHARLLLLAPLLTVVADLSENFTTFYLAWTYQEGSPSSVTYFAAACTATKLLLFVTCLVVILAGGVRGLLHPPPGG
jgi:hypothetical protein